MLKELILTVWIVLVLLTQTASALGMTRLPPDEKNSIAEVDNIVKNTFPGCLPGCGRRWSR